MAYSTNRVRSTHHIYGTQLSGQDSQTHIRPPTSVLKLSENLRSARLWCIYAYWYHDGKECEDVKHEESCLDSGNVAGE
jgi:hypothetical protein